MEHCDSTQSCGFIPTQHHPNTNPNSLSTTTQCSSHMQKKAPQWSLGTRLGSGSLGTRLGSGSLGTRLGSGSLGTRLDTSQIPSSELPPSAPLTNGIREWFHGITRGFPLSPTLPSSSTSFFLLLFLLFLPLSFCPHTGTGLRLLWSFSRHRLV